MTVYKNNRRGRFVPRQQYNNAQNRNQQEHHYQEQGQPREVSYQGENTSQYSNISSNTNQKKQSLMLLNGLVLNKNKEGLDPNEVSV